MLANWSKIGKMYRVFIIEETWGIRDHTLPTHNPSVLLHRCNDGGMGSIHDLKRCNFKCGACKIDIPEGVQAVWLLGTWNYDERWMK